MSYLPQKIDFVITCKNILGENRTDITRLSSIESQPKKVVVIVVVVAVVFVVVIIVGHINLTLKFGQNWVNNM